MHPGNSLIINRFWFALIKLITLCMLVLCANSFAAEKEVIALGDNLVNESCDMRARDDVEAYDGLPLDKIIHCNTRLAGQVSYARLASVPKTSEITDQQSWLLEQFERSRIQKTLALKVRCNTAVWADTPGLVAVFPCQLKVGGWPYLVVVSSSRTVMTAVDGSPAMLLPMLKATGLSEEVVAKLDAKTWLQSLWGHPIVLASSADLLHFKQQISAARNAMSQYKHEQAEELLYQALNMQIKLLSENDPSIADTLMDMALNASNMEKSQEAEGFFRRAEAIVQKSPFDADRARLATYLAYDSANRGRYDKALLNARVATQAWRKLASGGGIESLLQVSSDSAGPEQAELAMALNFEAKMYLRNGDVVTAGALASEALLLLQKTQSAPPFWKSDVMVTLGELSIAQNRLSAAETYFNSALAIRRNVFGEGAMTIPVLAALAAAYQREGMNSSAVITYRELFKIVHQMPSAVGSVGAEQLVPFAAAIVQYAGGLTDMNERAGLYAEAFDAFQLARTSVVGKTISKVQARLRNNDPQMAALVESLQVAQLQRDVLQSEWAKEQSLPDSERSAIVESRLQGEILSARKNIDSITAKLVIQYPAYSQLDNPPLLALQEMRKRLGDKEALVSFLIGKSQSFVQITRRTGNKVARVDAGDSQLQEAVQTLRVALDSQGGAVSEFNLKNAHALFQTLFAGVASDLKEVNHIIVVASGPLASLPFALLPVEAPKSNDYTKVQWLGQQVAISNAPSMQAFYSMREPRMRILPKQQLLAFANPVLGGGKSPTPPNSPVDCRSDGPMNNQTLLRLAPLPDTALEVRKVAQLLGAKQSKLFLSSDATESNFYKQNLADYRVLYFATHGLLPGELNCQTEPGLVLTPPRIQALDAKSDGLLAASEVSSLKLNADLVVLSACNTAGGNGRFGGDALSGLAQSFFFAGARSLVVSHWQVPSAATTQLMSGMFENLGPDLVGGVSLALQKAQSRLIAQPQTAHPFFWSAFVVVGDGMQTVELVP